jgi:hypothetical protein
MQTDMQARSDMRLSAYYEKSDHYEISNRVHVVNVEDYLSEFADIQT